MAPSGFLSIPEIRGEATDPGHEEEIAVRGISWSVLHRAATGASRARGHAEVAPLSLRKDYDAASPYIALAALRGSLLREARLSLVAPSGQEYLQVGLANCRIAAYEMIPDDETAAEPWRAAERFALSFDRLRLRYTVQHPDGTRGAEHEVEYDIVRAT